jgi:hypothetical protein
MNSTPDGQNTSRPNSSTPSNSSSHPTAPFVAPTPAALALDCPDGDGQIISDLYIPTGRTFRYQVTCGKDCQVKNIFPIWAYSLDMCMQACANMNAYNATDLACGAVAFRADMANVTSLGGNCFLKTGCDSISQNADVAHAVLLSF